LEALELGKKILLADDSITIQKVIELTFSDEDFEVVTVGNGRLAIERLPDARPDLVLCDIIMPEKDGYEVCDFIKKNPSLSHIPVLLLTGAFEPFDQERASRVGCDGFLAKPFEPQTLIAKVKDLLSRAPSRPAAAQMAAPAPSPATPPPPAPAPAPAPPATQSFATPASPPSPAAVPPAYDRGTGFDAPRPSEPELASPASPAWPPAPAPAPAFGEAAKSDVADFATPARPSSPPPAAFTPPAPPPAAFTAPAAPEPEPEPIEPEESLATSRAGAEDEDEALYGTVKAEPYRPDADRFGGAGGTTPKSLDEFYEDDTYTASASSDLMPLTDDETESVGGAPQEIDDDEPAAPWAQPTIEVPLEARAQASVEMAAGFDEPERPAAAREAAPAPAPTPAAAPASKPIEPPAAAPVPPPPTQELSFGDLSVPEPAVEKPRSVTSEVPVPVDMVEQIAQRVVAQISEKVIREIAWEVIPDLAEALIRKEIDRLKAEIPQT
jgi:CheY-like chemotaxis protein